MEKLMNNISLKLEKSNFDSVKISCSLNSYNCIKQFYLDDIELYESFFLLLLNRANQTTGYVKISQGGTAGTVVDPKIIAKYAIDSLSASVIIAHNHPSGNLKTSEADIAMTKKIQAGLMLFDIKLLDHLIITSSGFFSMADDGGIL
jgi:DNA repair protein RadC